MSFEQQANLFISQFMGTKPIHKLVAHLMLIKQGVDESLNDYARRFNEEALMVEDYIEKFVIHAMLSGLHLGGFKCNMSRNMLKTLAVMIEEAQKHTMVESIVFSKDSCEVKESRSVKPEGIVIIERAKEVGPLPDHLIKVPLTITFLLT